MTAIATMLLLTGCDTLFGGDNDDTADDDTTVTEDDTGSTTRTGDCEPTKDHPTISRFTVSLGEKCEGMCVHDLAFLAKGALKLEIRAQDGKKVLHESTGAFTQETMMEWGRAQSCVPWDTLQEEYDCTKCEGGMVTMAYQDADANKTVRYHLGEAPEDLKRVDGLFSEARRVLSKCTESKRVTYDKGCVPLEGPQK